MDRLERYKSRATSFNEIDKKDVIYSCNLLDALHEFTDYYVDDQWKFNSESFVRNVDGDFPGWTELVDTIVRFHEMFYMVYKYYPSNNKIDE